MLKRLRPSRDEDTVNRDIGNKVTQTDKEVEHLHQALTWAEFDPVATDAIQRKLGMRG